MRDTKIFLLLFVGVIFVSFSQKQNYYWYFGNGAGLNFNTNPPTALTDGKAVTFEGSATISDENGNLLFYTDGSTVWDKNHDVMTNGSGLRGSPSSTQSAVLVPMPRNPNRYYVFTVGFRDPVFCYSIVDMSLRGGLGDVLTASKNTELFTDGTFGTRYAAEKIIAVRHDNGRDFWIIGHDYQQRNHYTGSWSGVGTTFFVYLLTPSGLTVPNTYDIGRNHKDYRGFMRISSSGKMLAVCVVTQLNYSYTTGSYTAGVPSFLQLFDFNNATGVISLRTTGFKIKNRPVTDINGYYGVEFSPNEKYLYASIRHENNPIYQIDIAANTEKTIANNNDANALQLGPDGKIYVALSKRQVTTPGVGYLGEAYLGVIENANTATPIFNPRGVFLNGKHSYEGLPTFPMFFNLGKISFTPGLPICFNKQLNLMSDAYNFTDYTCDFGDGTITKGKVPADGQIKVSHTYKNTGNYDLKLTASRGLINKSVTEKITVYQSAINNFDPEQFCFGQGTKTMTATPVGGVYSGNGVTGNQFSPDNAGVGDHLIKYNYTDNKGCTAEKTVLYKVADFAEIELDKAEDFYCKTGVKRSVKVKKNKGTYTYAWKNSKGVVQSTTTTMEFDKPDTYSLKATYSNGCSKTYTFKVKEPPVDNVTKTALNIVHQHPDKGNYLTIFLHQFKYRSDYRFSIDDVAGNYQKKTEFTHLSAGKHTLYIKENEPACNHYQIEFFILDFPKYFSPDGDGINDEWRLKNWNKNLYSGDKIYIYNRFGKTIRTIPMGQSWDGKNEQGKKMLPNDYWFRIKITDSSGNLIDYIGHFSLL